MLYYQSENKRHSDRISVLNAIIDTYNYEDMEFPADLNYIEAFEERQSMRVCILNGCRNA